jgi:RNA polymerase sigma factor (sigma-70 family)
MAYQIDPNEILLVNECIDGKRKAQKLLYEKYKDAMYTLAYRFTGSFEEADDVLQDGFVQVFNSLESFKAESSLGAWIKTIMVRSAMRTKSMSLGFEDIEQIEDEHEIHWDSELTGEELEKAILNLSDGYRAVFTLIEIEGYRHHEVATLLNISEGTSKSQLYNAKRILKKELAFLMENL